MRLQSPPAAFEQRRGSLVDLQDFVIFARVPLISVLLSRCPPPPCARITLGFLTRYNEVFILRTDPIRFQLLAPRSRTICSSQLPAKIDLAHILRGIEHKGASGTDLRGPHTPQVVGQTLCRMTLLSGSCPVADKTQQIH